MKRAVIFALFVASMLINSCSQETDTGNDDNGKSEQTEKDRYYVKYEASNSIGYYLLNVSVNTESGTKTFDVKNRSFSKISGPVEKGFVSTISVEMDISTNVSIYVCKGEEPFALKKTGGATASYVIDF